MIRCVKIGSLGNFGELNAFRHDFPADYVLAQIASQRGSLEPEKAQA